MKMRTFFLSIAILSLASGLPTEQGIVFEQGSWQDVLAKAKKEDKLVFVDVYTSWCGPCKKMVAEVFPLKEVGDVFNAAFVNYKIDAEKGEGIQIAKQFGVKSYPTYLFVNGDGVLVYRSGGYNEAKLFLNEAAIAIKEKHDPKPLAEWDDEYRAGNRDKDFLLGYVRKRAAVKAPNGPLLEELFPLLSDHELADKGFLAAVFDFDPNMTFVPGGKLYGYAVEHHKAIDQTLEKRDGHTLGLLDMGMRQYFMTDIIKNSKASMLPVMRSSKRQLMELMGQEEIESTLKGLVMDYYAGTKNEEKLVPAAIDYVNNGLLKLDIAGKIAADKAAYQKMREPYLNGTSDSTAVENWTSMQRILSRQKMIDVSYKLRSAAQAIYAGTDDKEALSLALDWAKTADEYFPHFSTKAVYAGLLLKNGQQQAAADMMQLASEDGFIQGDDKQRMLLENAARIRKGELPKALW